MPASPELLVIIVTYNGMPWMARCIGSVRSSSLPADILVIDNGSTDGTADWLRSQGVETLEQPDNPGFGAANNIGLRYALERAYSYVYLLNQDAWVRPDTFSRLIAAFRGHPEYGILSPVQYDGGGVQWDRNFARHCARALASGNGDVAEVPFVMAAHWMLTRVCVCAVGGFSPAFRQYGEDDNYIDRARYFGFRTGVVREAGAIHAREGRPCSREAEMSLKCVGSVVRVSSPHRPSAPTLLGELVRLFAMGIYHRSTLPWRRLQELLRRYPSLKTIRKQSLQKGAFL